MNYIFECSNRYLTSERSERVGYRVEHEKIKFISTSGHVIFCLLYKHTNNDVFFTTFRRFPTTFRRFPKFSKLVPKAWRSSPNIFEHFPKIAEEFPKIAEDFRGDTDDVAIIQHQLWVLFERLCSYSNGNLKTFDNNLLFSRVKISCYLHVWR